MTAPHKLTVPVLEGSMNIILAAIEALRTTATIGINVRSRDAVRSSMHQARNHLSRAIVELDKKGITNQYVNHITSCQESLEKALQYW